MLFSHHTKLPATIQTVFGSGLPFCLIDTISHNFIDILFGYSFLWFWRQSLSFWFNFYEYSFKLTISGFDFNKKIWKISVKSIVCWRFVRNDKFFWSPRYDIIISVKPIHDFAFPAWPVNDIIIIPNIFLWIFRGKLSRICHK